MVNEWLAEYGGQGSPMPEITGTYAGKSLVIVGDAHCVWDDLEAFGCKVTHRRGCVAKDGWDFLTINKAVECFPGNIEHAYSNEPHLLAKFIAARRNEYQREFSGPMHTHSGTKGAKHNWPWGNWGTSGLGACFVGAALGYDAVVLCGVPLDDGPHNGEPHWRKCGFTNEAASTAGGGPSKHWQKAKKALGPRLTSMSGRTKQWLGAPKL